MVSNNKLNESLVSIIMPAFNAEKFIDSAVNSVMNQTYKNWELLIIDDCSKDDTYKIISKYASNDRRIIILENEVNSGAAISRNKGIDKATGKYIAFLDSDDVWFDSKLSKQISYMEKNDYKFTCTSYNKINELSESLNKVIIAKEKSDYWELLKTCPGNSTVIYNSEKLGKFKIPNFQKRNDYLLWLNVIKKSNDLRGIQETLSSHRIHNNSISSNKSSLVTYHWKIYRNVESLSFFKSTYLIVYWIFMTMFKLR